MAYTAATDGKLIAHATTADLISTLEVFANMPQVWPDLRKSYGQDILTFDMIETLKNSSDFVGADNWEVHESLPPFRTMTVGATLSGGGSAGAYMTFSIQDVSTNIDSEDNFMPREGQSFYAGTAQTMVECYIDDITVTPGTPDTIIVKAYPKDVTKRLDTYITAGKVLPMVPAIQGGQGTGPATPTHVGYRKWTFYTEILKDALGYDNATLATARYVEPVAGKFYSDEIERMNMNLDAAMEAHIWFGTLITNTAITQTNLNTNSAVAVQGTEGLWSHAATRGTGITYTAATDFTMEHFYQIAEYGQAIGILYGDWIMDLGQRLDNRIEKSCKAYITNATGSLSDMFTPDAGGGEKELTVGFKKIQIGRQHIVLKPNFLFNNPQIFGVAEMGLLDAGFIAPYGMVRDLKTNKMMSNISIRYRGMPGFPERKRMIAPFVGMGGPKGMIGAPVVLTGDVTQVHAFTEWGLNAMEGWKFIRVYRTDL